MCPENDKTSQAGQSVPPAVDVCQEPSASNEIQQLAQELDEAKKEASQHYDHLLRTRADFENYRKRIIKEKDEFAKFANENIIRDLLPVLDDMELALKNNKVSAEKQGGKPAPEETVGLCQGIQLIHQKLQETLKRYGLEPISTEGQPFNPALHEAVRTIEATAIQSNIVTEELRRGYLLGGRILRPAMVTVAKAVQK